MNKDSILKCLDIGQEYQDNQQVSSQVLHGLNLEVYPGEHLAIMGRSGSGKTSLLQILAGLRQPSSGKIYFKNRNLAKLTEAEICRFRNQDLGFIYQFHHLLPEFSARENVSMPLLIAGIPRAKAYAKAENLLSLVNLSHKFAARPAELSGGERQRVAIARALVHQPAYVLADEPTGNLDAENAQVIIDLILNLSRKLKFTFIVATHDQQLAAQMNKTLWLYDGQLQEGAN